MFSIIKTIKCFKLCPNFQLYNKKLIKNQLFLKVLDKNFLIIRVCLSNQKSITDENNWSESEEWTESQYQRNVNKSLNSDNRGIAKTVEEYRLQQRLPIEQPAIPRLARVVIIGSPNAGKSTLTNQLIGWRVSSVSSKVHTTRHKVVGVLVEDDSQIEFLDTPGVVSTKHCVKHNLESTFRSDPLVGSESADIIAVITDVSNVRENDRLNPGIIHLLERHPNKESVLILNKTDKIRDKRKLLDITTRLTDGVVGGVSSIKMPKRRQIPKTSKGLQQLFESTEQRINYERSYRTEQEVDETELNGQEVEEKVGWSGFSHVFMVSSLLGEGTEDIRQYFLSRVRFRPWIYHRSQITDQSPVELVKTTLRETFLDNFRDEIPYKISFSITMWTVDESGNLYISVNVICPARFQSLIIGPKGETISKIVQTVRHNLSNTFHCDVSLKLIVIGIKNSNQK